MSLSTRASRFAIPEFSWAWSNYRDAFSQYGDQFTRPVNLVTNGPFKLAEWVVQSHIRLVRNHYYWDDANVRLDEVWFYPTEDQPAELKRYRAPFPPSIIFPTAEAPGTARSNPRPA